MSKLPIDNEFIVKKPWSGRMINACLFLAAGLLAGSWYYYEYHYLANKEIPLLTREEGPTKIKPERVGGALVPNMDKIVYDSLKPGSDTARLVSMMPEPEQPIEMAPSNTKDVIEDIIGKILSENHSDNEQIIVEPESLELHEKAPEEIARTLKIIPVENSGIKNQQVKAVKMPAFYKAQLVSVRTKSIAEQEWERLKKIHHKYLGALAYSIQKIDVKSHGVFYRLLVGKFSSFGAAKSLCKKLIGTQQNCIVVKE